MAKRKQGNPWDRVYDVIRVTRYPEWVHVPPTTDAECDKAELQLGSRLPRSYREFMKRFGPGELEDWVRLTPISPLSQAYGTVAKDTAGLREMFRDGWRRNAAWLARLVFFATSAGGDSYAWDPEKRTRTRSHEFEFYYLRRGSEDSPRPAGQTFAEFIQWVKAESGSWREDDPTAVTAPGFAFRPFYLRKKKVPRPADVKRWLAFNNNAVRDLALAIRDHGRTEAFPVLADALEEAGCTNPDVLDSCRRGDPDIDGLWVLRVLLGEK